jgi:hypothetical protein
MNRRTFIATALASPGASTATAATAQRPNFLFLIADDLTYKGIRALTFPPRRV